MKKFDVVQVVRGSHEGERGEVLNVVVSEGEETVLVEMFNGDYQTFDIDDLQVINE